ncbi:ABC transporter ATP-binding protein [Haloechinothrix sp. LS1_15]|uniref:ABC transporter ATP-binding protein n=1 Tax=Haloechinothrix sp. LS1_15 TaxID=2652248 RepID=UPI0029441B7A|nr:ABC transporter ATP-binding protein [Haloechinothrix sp. LS1_15]MDV6014597.1 ABC transporter ATP-binding protein [Haloechinothrix sp. LS1_15]
MLALGDITAGYGETTVLREVSLWVPPASVVALLGANGAGKTTLLRVASGLCRPRSGTVRMDGADVTGHRPHVTARRGMCHIPEGRGVFPHLSVRENLAIHAAGGDADETVDRAVSAFPVLGSKLGQQAGALSGGQQQMLALSRAYLTDPCYVLLDEVSMGLAPVVVDEIFEFLTGLRRQGCALLLVEQYVTRALAVADYVYLLSRGRVEFAGEPGELDAEQLTARYLGTDHGN